VILQNSPTHPLTSSNIFQPPPTSCYISLGHYPTFSDIFRRYPTLSDIFRRYPTSSEMHQSTLKSSNTASDTLSDPSKFSNTSSDFLQHLPTSSYILLHQPSTLSDIFPNNCNAAFSNIIRHRLWATLTVTVSPKTGGPRSVEANTTTGALQATDFPLQRSTLEITEAASAPLYSPRLAAPAAGIAARPRP
jgi:hypothetical protein